MADPIAEAFVRIRPDTDGFKEETRAKLERELADLGVTVKVRADTTGAKADTDKLKAQVEGKEIKPKVKPEVDTAKVDQLKASLTELDRRTATARADVDDKAASAKLLAINAKLAEVGKKVASPRLDLAGVARTEADLAAIDLELDRIGAKRETARVDVDVSGALGSISTLTAAFAALAPALIPIGAVLAGSLAGFTGALTAAGAGVGGLVASVIPALDNVHKAMQAQTAAQKAAATTAAQSAGSQVSSANAIKSAELSLADARRQAGQQAIAAAEAVRNAEQGVADAERQAAQDRITEAESIQNAQRSLADAVKQAAFDQHTGIEQIAAAEQDLKQAEQAELVAQQAITDARKEAANALVDLNNNLEDTQLAVRSGALQVRQAKQSLDQALANPKATQLQREQAKLAYDEAVQQYNEQKLQLARLQAEQQDANKKGIDGSKQVTQARQNEQQAQTNVISKEQALADTRAQVARQAASDAEAVAKAQQQVADAQRQAAQQQEGDAEAIAKAQQAVSDAVRAQANQQAQSASTVAHAQLALQNAYASSAQAASQGGTAAEKAAAQAKAAFDRLTPSEKSLYIAFKTFKDQFEAWGRSLEPHTIPVLTGALGTLMQVFRLLSPAIVGAAGALVGLETSASNALDKPYWKKFFDLLGKEAGPAVTAFGVAIGGIVTGFAGMVTAFAPLTTQFERNLDGLTSRFATWGKNLSGSSGFKSFMDYIHQNGPLVGRTIGDMASALIDLLIAAAPLGPPILAIVDGLARLVIWLHNSHPALLTAVAASLLWFGAVAKVVTVLGALVRLAPAVAIAVDVMTGPFGLAALAIGLTALATYGLIKNFEAVKRYVLKWGPEVVAPILPFIGLPWLAYQQWTKHGNELIGFMGSMWKRITGIFSTGWSVISTANSAGLSLARSAWSTGWTAVSNFFGSIRAKIVNTASALWAGIRNNQVNGLSAVRSGFASGWDAVWSTAVNVKNKIVNTFKAGWSSIIGGVRTAVSAIGTAWGAVENAFKTPVKWVIDHIWNGGLVRAWNDVAGLVHLPKLDPVKLEMGGPIPNRAPTGPIKALAAGGAVPVVPMVTNRPTAIVGEGNPAYPEFVIPTDPKYGRRATALYSVLGGLLGQGVGRAGASMPAASTIGANKYATGGALSVGSILGDIGKTISGVPSSILDTVKDGAGHAIHLVRSGAAWGFNKAIGPLRASLDHFLGSEPPWHVAIDRSINKLFDGALSAVAGRENKQAASGGGPVNNAQFTGSGAVKTWITEALNLMHMSLKFIPGIFRLIMHESAGNPNAINLWDSNAMAGHPSKGIMQTIDSTFRKYVLPALANKSIYDPVANITAGTRYALSRYGPEMLLAGGRRGPDGGYIGYAQGGRAPAGRAFVAGENGPEVIETDSKATVTPMPRFLAAGGPLSNTSNILSNTISSIRTIGPTEKQLRVLFRYRQQQHQRYLESVRIQQRHREERYRREYLSRIESERRRERAYSYKHRQEGQVAPAVLTEAVRVGVAAGMPNGVEFTPAGTRAFVKFVNDNNKRIAGQ